MVSFCLKIKFLVAIFITVALICSGVFSWQYLARHKKMVLSDQQIIWILVGLLVIAAMSMGTFLLILLEGVHSWQYLQI